MLRDYILFHRREKQIPWYFTKELSKRFSRRFSCSTHVLLLHFTKTDLMRNRGVPFPHSIFIRCQKYCIPYCCQVVGSVCVFGRTCFLQGTNFGYKRYVASPLFLVLDIIKMLQSTPGGVVWRSYTQFHFAGWQLFYAQGIFPLLQGCLMETKKYVICNLPSAGSRKCAGAFQFTIERMRSLRWIWRSMEAPVFANYFLSTLVLGRRI